MKYCMQLHTLMNSMLIDLMSTNLQKAVLPMDMNDSHKTTPFWTQIISLCQTFPWVRDPNPKLPSMITNKHTFQVFLLKPVKNPNEWFPPRNDFWNLKSHHSIKDFATTRNDQTWMKRRIAQWLHHGIYTDLIADCHVWKIESHCKSWSWANA
jgi:hypothetical protein